mmetsp:Transcript_10310/g.15590  ORF Transcript_10310/g.15590 Transcript_10310/m.15590 type:complete len:270 (+) Transcript_10310:2053-2862(+)
MAFSNNPRRARVTALVEQNPAALVRSACRRALAAPAALGLPMPIAPDLLLSEWKAEVKLAINRVELQALKQQASLQWLVTLKPSYRWRRKFIIQKPRSDIGSLLIAGLLLDRVYIVPDTRGAIMRPVRTGICDLCAHGHQHFGAGGRLGTFLACPALDYPRHLWLASSRSLAIEYGVGPWWDQQAQLYPPTAHSFLSLAFGADNPARTPAELGDAMTDAFTNAFAPYLPPIEARLRSAAAALAGSAAAAHDASSSTVLQHETSGVGLAL